MTLYQLGSMGPEVGQIQTALAQRRYYAGPIDGKFGGGTRAAVMAAQQALGLSVDGVVGQATWDALLGGAPPAPEIASKPLDERCLALTGAFETDSPPPDCFAGLAGDFDQQGLSFGALQWCLGQGSLQPLFQRLAAEHPEVLKAVFGPEADEFSTMLAASRDEQLAWARSIQTQNYTVVQPWQGLFKTLGRTPEFQEIERAAAAALYAEAKALCQRFGVVSQRALALMFDIRVQNGGINTIVEGQIRADIARLGSPDEVTCLRIVANRRAEAARPAYVEDVRRRKLAIAEGGGQVHGRTYDLAVQYGITLEAGL